MAQILKPPMGIAILAMIDPKRRRDERRAARPGLRWLLTLSILSWRCIGFRWEMDRFSDLDRRCRDIQLGDRRIGQYAMA